MPRFSRYGIVLAAFVALSSQAIAGPFDSFLPFRRVKANPNESYFLTPKHGPWMIMCASFAREDAQQQARELVLELRRNHNLEAFIFRGHFDFNQMTMGKGFDRYGNRQRMKNLHRGAFDEYAVLVGNFPSINDSNAQAALKKIKYLHPDCLDLKRKGRTSQRFAVWRYIQRAVNGDQAKKRKGPMGKAFMTRNPLAGQDRNALYQDQQFLLQVNKDVQYSLLKNPHKYTVRVATFRGQVLIDLEKNFSQKKDKMTSKLEEAAMKAHKLTLALRRRGFEAYEFHDRHESVVTVGGFPEVGRPRADGKTEIHPGILALMKKLSARPRQGIGQFNGALQPITVEGIPLDIQPVPVGVPKISVAVQATQSRWR